NAGKPARQLFDEGREHYLRGRYAEAVAALEAAAASRGDLSASDRDRLQKYLELARSKSGSGSAADEVVARAQSADQPPAAKITGDTRPATAAPNANTAARPEAAKKLLVEARQKFNGGKITEAETLAQNCRKLGVHWRMFADNPEKLLEEIKEFRRQETAWKKDSSSVDARRNRSNYLLTRARQVLEEGDTATADRLVHEAEQIKVPRKLNDLKPEQLRQQLAKKPAAARKPSGVVSAEGLELAGTKRRDIRQVVAADDDEEGLEMPADSAPEITSPSRAPGAGKPAQPAPTAQPATVRPASPAREKEGMKDSPAKAGGSKADRVQAQELLKQAEALLAEGRTQEARAKVQKAEKLDVAYDLLGLSPDYLMPLIDRAERDTLVAQNEKQPASKDTQPKVTASKAAEPKGTSSKLTADRQKAQILTRQAEADLEAGRRDEAKSKAAQARDIDVAYDLLEKTPEDVLEATQETDQRYLAGKKRPAPALVPADDDLPEMASDEIAEASASAGNEMEDIAVARPELSALDCYQRGKQAMRSGNSELATKFYLQAWQSGERLDSRKMQEIQEYLAQHRGKAKKIQLLGTRPASRNG
ncbi:MAG TPA: hypothetical protein VG099_13335, partial [Gemmataceae bacterium]|nr:hypothetical protein [Gemmataceae bacterium]